MLIFYHETGFYKRTKSAIFPRAHFVKWLHLKCCEYINSALWKVRSYGVNVPADRVRNQTSKRIYFLSSFAYYLNTINVKLVRKVSCKDRIRMWSVGFCGGGKTGQKPLKRDNSQQQTHPTYETRFRNRRGGASVVTTVSTLILSGRENTLIQQVRFVIVTLKICNYLTKYASATIHSDPFDVSSF